MFAVSDVASYLESINHYLGYLEDYHQINHKEDKMINKEIWNID
ncbi:hypothetical protein ScOT1_05880 [Streptococcus canis]|nr:hypothetical protein ScOT1_05880 [Streptococcus canis]